jgi:hypothetical protein
MSNDSSIVQDNVIVSNVFSDADFKVLYDDINTEITKYHQPQVTLGRLYSVLYWKESKIENNGPVDFKTNMSIVNKIIDSAQTHSDVELQLESISFTRYSLDYGIPDLPPHVDTNFKQPRLTFDIQLKSNTSWPIIVEEELYTLKDNEALIFSGTHQVHWRQKKQFNKNEYVDMLLCQFSEKTNIDNTISLDFIKQRDIKQKLLKLKYEKGLI